MTDLPTALLPVLSRTVRVQFNVFDVMHHGTHEKQLSNVFGWLLDTQGTHGLGDRFLRIFVQEVNQSRPPGDLLPESGYQVHQEVDTAGPDDPAHDIADLVLTNDEAVIVVENYYTSNGHGHSYDRYLRHSKPTEDRSGVVVLLCQDHDASQQSKGWEDAAVVTYARLLDRMWRVVKVDRQYKLKHPEPYSFIDQMHRKFVEGRGPVEDGEILDFVVAMCDTGEAERYGEQPHVSAAERFANDVSVQARERFGEGRELLARVKQRLSTFSSEHLSRQLNVALGEGFVGRGSSPNQGIYQWTVNLGLPGFVRPPQMQSQETQLQLKFGPSAWFANEQDPDWKLRVEPAVADYSRLFVTWPATWEIRQSAVTVREVLDGLAVDDLRLRDEILEMVRGAG